MSKNSDLISIIVPIYNVEKYLDRCIRSLTAQTYENIEIILIDDGSTDDSLSIALQQANLDSRVKVFHKENGGLSSARNYGIEKACGNYLTFVDSDDFINEHYVEALASCASQDTISVISHKTFFDESGFDGERVTEYHFVEIDKHEVLLRFLRDNNFVSAWGKLYPAKAFKSIRFPENRIYEDFSTTYKLYYLCSKFCVSDAKLYYYQTRRNSITNAPFSTKNLDMITACDEFEAFMAENDLEYLRSGFEDRKVRDYLTLYYKISLSDDADSYIQTKTHVKSYLDAIKFSSAKSFSLKTKMLLILFKLSPKLFTGLVKRLKG